MNALAAIQERARLFNEAEAIQQDFEQRRRSRALSASPALVPEEVLDDLDWFAATRAHRQTRAVSVSLLNQAATP